MSSLPSRLRLDQEGRVWIGIAFALATAVRAAFALSFPTIHGGDATARLAGASSVLLGYQLPLPQLMVVAGKAILDDPLLVRLIFCFWGGLLAAGLVALLGLTLDSRAALFGSLLLSFDPLLVHYSIVPYQEPVAYGLLAWAFYFAASRQEMVGTLLMSAACLSRYEVWLFLPAFLWVSRSRTATGVASLPMFGWILWWQGLAPPGLYVVDLDLEAGRLSRFVFLARKFIEYETALVPVVAGIAIAWSVARPDRMVLRVAGSLALIIALIIAFGHEYPPGSGLLSERLIHLPVLLGLSLAAIALQQISARSTLAFAACIAGSILFAGRSVRFETALLRAAAREPDLALARDLARAIESHRASGECVTVFAPGVDPTFADRYVAKVGAAFGNADRARERAGSLADASPDRDRIAAHLRARTGTVRSLLGCPLVVLVDDAGLEETRASRSSMTLVAQISAGPRRAEVFRIRP